MRAGLGLSKLGSKYQHCAASCRWPCVHAEAWGREMPPASSFVSGGVSLSMLPLWDMLRDECIAGLPCASSSLQNAVSTLYVHGLFVLLSIQEQPQCPLSSPRSEYVDL